MGATTFMANEVSNDDLVALIAEVLECAKEELSEASRFREHESWDSLAHLSTVAMVDEKFGVVLRAEEFKGIHTIAELADYVRNAQRS